MTRREGGATLLLDGLDVDAGRAASSDHDDRCVAAAAFLLENPRREAFRVPMAEDKDGVAVCGSRPVDGGVHRLDGGGPNARLTKQPDGVVGGVPARAGADRDNALSRQPLRLCLDGCRVGEQRP